jgi:LuxR family glucitol operon transcriptional activator
MLSEWVANHSAVLAIRCHKYTEALQWVEIEGELIEEAQLTESGRTRAHLTNVYYRGIIAYETHKFVEAGQFFQQAIQLAERIGWQRATIYVQNYLADIALAQGDLQTAERLLQTGLPVAARNKDKRREAFYKRSFAHLAIARAHQAEACHWAAAALDDFERLGMQPEADELRELLESLECH